MQDNLLNYTGLTQYDGKIKEYIGDSAGTKIISVTQAQYDALTQAQKESGTYFITDANGGTYSADNCTYDNTDSGLTATNVQDAIDELAEEKLSNINPLYNLDSPDNENSRIMSNQASASASSFLTAIQSKSADGTIGRIQASTSDNRFGFFSKRSDESSWHRRACILDEPSSDPVAAAGVVQPVLNVQWRTTDGTTIYNRTVNPISVIGNDASNTNNNGVSLGSKTGTTFISAGESGNHLPGAMSAYDNEDLYATADGKIHFVTNASNDGSSYNEAIMSNNILSGVNNNYCGTCSTAADQQIKVVTISNAPAFKLIPGCMVAVKFTYTNTYSATAENPVKLNVNNTGDINIWYNNTGTPIGTNTVPFGYADRTNYYMYDGTYWVWAGMSNENNTTYTPQSLGFGYGTCDTAAATVAKVVTLSGYTLVTNGIVAVKFTNAVPASATLNINSKGAKPIYYKGAAITADVISAGDTATFIYNGTNYILISVDNSSEIEFGIENDQYGYYNASGVFVPFKSQADIDAAVSAAMVGDAADGDVLSGKTFTNSTDSGLTGTMPNNGAISKTITPKTSAQTYTIPTGYHNGSGKVTVPDVAITAPAASKILTGSSVSVTSNGTTLKSVTGSMADYSSNVQTITCNSNTGTQTYTGLADGYHTSIKVNQTAPYNAGKAAGQAAPSIVSYTVSIPASIGIPAAKTLYNTITASTMGMSKIYGCTVTAGTTTESRPYAVSVSLASGLASASIYVQSGDGYARTSSTAASLVFRGLSA